MGSGPQPPNDGRTQARWAATSKRQRVLETPKWRDDLQDHMALHVGPTRLRAWGRPTIAYNLLRSVVAQVATLYRIPPVVVNPLFEDDPEAAEYFGKLGVFSRHPRLARLNVGLRECFAHVQWTHGEPAILDEAGTVVAAATAGRVEVQVVSPTMIAASSTAASPGVPDLLSWAVEMTDPRTNKPGWFWQVWDLRIPSMPRFRIADATGKRNDRTQEFGRASDDYEWIDPDTGRPFMPWVLYHAEDTGRLFDPHGWHELLDGTYDVAMLATEWLHVVKNASWKQPYGINVDVQGGKTTGGGQNQARHVTTDQSSVLMFTATGDQAQVAMLDKPSEPEEVLAAVMTYSDWLLAQVGMRAANTPSKNLERPESGAAIVVRGDGLVTVQQTFVEEFRKGDLKLLEVVAQVSNALGDALVPPLPTSGWSIAYPAAPLTREQLASKLTDGQAAAVREVVAEVAAGTLPRENGVQMLITLYDVPAETAELLMGEVGRSFVLDTSDDPEGTEPGADPDTGEPTGEITVNELSLAIQRLLGTKDTALINDLRRELAKKLGTPPRPDIELPDDATPGPS